MKLLHGYLPEGTIQNFRWADLSPLPPTQECCKYAGKHIGDSLSAQEDGARTHAGLPLPDPFLDLVSTSQPKEAGTGWEDSRAEMFQGRGKVGEGGLGGGLGPGVRWDKPK